MPEHENTRHGVGRREDDQACREHEQRMDGMDKELHTLLGWIKTSGLLITVAGAIIGYMGTNINAKLTSIETLLSDNKVMLERHNQQIIQLQGDVKDIQDRHKYLDQNGVIVRKP